MSRLLLDFVPSRATVLGSGRRDGNWNAPTPHQRSGRGFDLPACASRAEVASARQQSERGEYRLLTGNEIGVLLAHYLLVDDPKPANDRLVITTIVSSPLLSVIARELEVRYDETLTGFKWIVDILKRSNR